MKINLKPIEIEAIEKIRNWRNSNLIMNVSFNRNFISRDMQREWFEKIKFRTDQKHWLINVNNIDIGYAAIKNIDLQNFRCEFASLYIGEPDMLLTGVGAFAEFEVIEYVYSHFPSINKIYCEVLGFNKKVIQLHQRFGFVVEGELKRHYCLDGKPEDVVLMALFKDNWYNTRERIKKILGI